MLINIIDVAQPQTSTNRNGRQYQSLEVTYKDDQGRVSSKKLMSFSNPDVFRTAQTWEKGDSVNIAMEKDDAGYWNWTAVLADGEVAPAPTSQSVAASSTSDSKAKPTRVTGSNYETKEERALRQLMIVRQSSLSNAVATLATHGKPLSSADVVALAKQYERFVMEGNSSTANVIDDLTGDIPY
jgi:hypothetical protein